MKRKGALYETPLIRTEGSARGRVTVKAGGTIDVPIVLPNPHRQGAQTAQVYRVL